MLLMLLCVCVCVSDLRNGRARVGIAHVAHEATSSARPEPRHQPPAGRKPAAKRTHSHMRAGGDTRRNAEKQFRLNVPKEH
jgi:hypothetical protein